MPRNIKAYALSELNKILQQKNGEYAFYIKKQGRGKRPNKATRDRNIEIAKYVYNHKYYEGDALRATPLSDEVAIEEVTNMEQPLSEQTIRDAFYEHKKLAECYVFPPDEDDL